MSGRTRSVVIGPNSPRLSMPKDTQPTDMDRYTMSARREIWLLDSEGRLSQRAPKSAIPVRIRNLRLLMQVTVSRRCKNLQAAYVFKRVWKPLKTASRHRAHVYSMVSSVPCISAAVVNFTAHQGCAEKCNITQSIHHGYFVCPIARYAKAVQVEPASSPPKCLVLHKPDLRHAVSCCPAVVLRLMLNAARIT